MNSTPDPVEVTANMIRSLTPKQLLALRRNLEEDEGGMAGVGAAIPPNLPLNEGAAEADLPEDYWETAQ